MQGEVRKRAVGVTYHLTMCDKDFAQLLHNDKHSKELPFFAKLHRVNGIVDVTYAKHLGATVILTLDTDYDTSVTWINIRNALFAHVDGK